jgi:hypothetical protein
MRSQEFYWDFDNDAFYLVNYQEKRYMKIAEKGSVYYPLCMRMYCSRWREVEKDVTTNFRKVDRLEQIDGSED